MKPAILFLDIETFPDVAYVWGVYQQNAIDIVEHWYVLSFAAKWRGQQGVVVKGLDDYRGYKGGASTERSLLTRVVYLSLHSEGASGHDGV